MQVRPHPKFPAIFQAFLDDGSIRLATKNLTPGRSVYGEKRLRYKNNEYRLWDPFRSKMAAAIQKNIINIPIKPKHTILYLGVASGTTASHISDILGRKGHIYCVDFAPREVRELVNNVTIYRSNMSPILEDVRCPENYAFLIDGKMDDIYCDVAQPEQARILGNNAQFFLKKKGWIMLTIKARSINVTKQPSKIFRREEKTIKKYGFEISETISLEPYDKDHVMVVAQKK